MIVYGINPVHEALKVGRVTALRVAERSSGRVAALAAAAEQAGVPVRRVSAGELDRTSRGAVHQGVVADVADVPRAELADLLTGPEAPLIVVLDGVEDPHNVGAILRSVDAAGATGVVRQMRRAAPLEGAAAKASAGAVSTVKVVDVVNIARTLEELKAAGVWVVGLDGEARTRLDQIDLRLPTALVVGAEGEGMRRLVRERCDWLAAIPLRGSVQSLNVSVAAGIGLFEAVRQRLVSPDAPCPFP